MVCFGMYEALKWNACACSVYVLFIYSIYNSDIFVSCQVLSRSHQIHLAAPLGAVTPCAHTTPPTHARTRPSTGMLPMRIYIYTNCCPNNNVLVRGLVKITNAIYL